MISTLKSMDTLKIYDRLKKVESFDAQARELAEILSELVDDQIVTKNDLKNTESSLKLDLKQIEFELKETEARLQADIKAVDARVKETEAKLQMEIQKSKAEILKWVIGLMLAQTGFLMGFMKLAF